jgi:hypothetical protein
LRHVRKKEDHLQKIFSERAGWNRIAEIAIEECGALDKKMRAHNIKSAYLPEPRSNAAAN